MARGREDQPRLLSVDARSNTIVEAAALHFPDQSRSFRPCKWRPNCGLVQKGVTAGAELTLPGRVTGSEPAVTRLTWRASSSQPPRRSATGLCRPTVRRGAGRRRGMAWARPSARGWPDYAVKTSSCGWSATSSLERQLGSRARPAPCRPLSALLTSLRRIASDGVRVHEREPGHVPDRHHREAIPGGRCREAA